ncbi:hypothetical protein BH20VER3_BH20VER3_19950 [soil metagenome]
MKWSGLFAEWQRRGVYKVAVAYVLVGAARWLWLPGLAAIVYGLPWARTI